MSRRLAWSLLALTAAVLVAAVVLAIGDPHSGGPADPSSTGPTLHDKPSSGTALFAAFEAAIFGTLAGAGAIVAIRRPRNPIGWLFGVAALCLALLMLCDALYWHAAFGRPGSHSTAEIALWVEGWVWIPALVALFSMVPLLFPTGAPPSRRWRVVVWAAATTGTVTLVSTAFKPGAIENAAWVDNPLAVHGLGLRAIAEVTFVLWLVSALAAVVSLVVRFRRSQGVERQQLKWVKAAGCLLLASFPVSALLDSLASEVVGFVGLLFGLLSLALAVSVALLRYRLYDLDVVLNRALVYAALTATLAAGYVGSVLVLQLVLSPGSDLAIAASTLGVAALFRPARSRIQELVDRRFYRRRYDAQRTLERFGGHVREQVDLDALAGELRDVISETLQPVHVSLWIRGTGR